MRAKIIDIAAKVLFALVVLGAGMLFASTIVMGYAKGQQASGIFAGIGAISLIGAVLVGVIIYTMEKSMKRSAQTA